MLSIVLHIGSQGPSVARAQQLLREKGFPAVDEEGLFGTSTEEAVRRFQGAHNLQMDGTVGPSTWKALEAKPELENAAKAAMSAAAPPLSTQEPMTTQGAPAPMSASTGPATVSTSLVPFTPPAAPSLVDRLGKWFVYGGLALVGYSLWRSKNPPQRPFDSYEDDYGLEPLPPGADDEDDGEDGEEDGDIEADFSDAEDEGKISGAADTGIVPFGGGPSLKRGPGGKFLPRKGKKIAVDVGE